MPARISSRRLVERRAELEALERALERGEEGDPTVTLVEREAQLSVLEDVVLAGVVVSATNLIHAR